MTKLANGLTLIAEYPPLRLDEGGTVRVGKGRIAQAMARKLQPGGVPPYLANALTSICATVTP